MGYLIYVHLYDFFMYFDYIYFVLVMFGRMQYKQWNPSNAWFQFTWRSSLIIGLREKTNLQLFEFIFVEMCSNFLYGRPFEIWIQFSHPWCSWHFIVDISHNACIMIIWGLGIIFGLISVNFWGQQAVWEIITPHFYLDL